MKKILYFILALVSIAACEKNVSDDSKLSEVYVDLVVAREKYINNDSLYFLEKHKVFYKYNTDEIEFNKTLDEIKYDKKRWEKFFTHSMSYLDTLSNKDSLLKK